jgi:predicted GH43/DUF377 family glycosyl hydrolase
MVKRPPVVMLGKFGDLICILPALQRMAQVNGEPVKVVVGDKYKSILDGVSYVDPMPLALEWPKETPKAREQAVKEFGSAIVPQFWTVPQINDIPRGNFPLEIGNQRWSIDEKKWPNYMSAMWQRLGFTDADMRRMPLVFDRRSPERESMLKARYIHPTLPTLLVNFTSASSPFGYEPEIMRGLPRGAFSVVNLAEIKAERLYDLLGLFDAAAGMLTCATSTLHLAAASKIPYIAFTEDHWSRAVPKGNCKLNLPYSQTTQFLDRIANIVMGWAKPVAPPKPIIFDETNAPSITKQTPWECALFNFSKSQYPVRPGTDYFNCGLVEKSDGDWLLVRRSQWQHNMAFGMNSLIAFRLMGETPTEGRPIVFPRAQKGEHFEDPRVFMHGEKMFISATNFIWSSVFPKAHQILAVADTDWKIKSVYHPIVGKNGYRFEANSGSEKNWIWFFHEDQLHLIYMLHPHCVVRFDDQWRVTQIYETECPQINWPWGGPRGGTPPILVGNEYWSFFHSSVDWCEHGSRRYHMGAYAFECNPPFRITRFVRKPLLNGSIHDPWSKGKPLVVFPCGAIFRHGEWFVTLGVNDLVCGWIKIPHDDLVAKTIPIDRHIDLRLTHVKC